MSMICASNDANSFILLDGTLHACKCISFRALDIHFDEKPFSRQCQLIDGSMFLIFVVPNKLIDDMYPRVARIRKCMAQRIEPIIIHLEDIHLFCMTNGIQCEKSLCRSTIQDDIRRERLPIHGIVMWGTSVLLTQNSTKIALGLPLRRPALHKETTAMPVRVPKPCILIPIHMNRPSIRRILICKIIIKCLELPQPFHIRSTRSQLRILRVMITMNHFLPNIIENILPGKEILPAKIRFGKQLRPDFLCKTLRYDVNWQSLLQCMRQANRNVFALQQYLPRLWMMIPDFHHTDVAKPLAELQP